MLVLAMEFSRGTTACRGAAPWQRRRNNSATVSVRLARESQRAQQAEARCAHRQSTGSRPKQHRIASDQLGVLSCRLETVPLLEVAPQAGTDRDSLERR